MTERITISAEDLRAAIADIVARRTGTHLSSITVSGSVVAEYELPKGGGAPDGGAVPMGGAFTRG